MTSGVSMHAMTRNVPPHTAQCSMPFAPDVDSVDRFVEGVSDGARKQDSPRRYSPPITREITYDQDAEVRQQ